METAVRSRGQGQGEAEDSPLTRLSAAVDDVLGSGLCPASVAAAPVVLEMLEREARRLHAASLEVMEQIEESEFGVFGWFLDPEGNKVELWRPPDA